MESRQTWERLGEQATPVGFEPTRGDPIGLAGRRLSHSAKVSLDLVDLSLSCFENSFKDVRKSIDLENKASVV